MTETFKYDRSYPTGNHKLLAESLNIKPGDKVLDIGAGHNPIDFADIVVDIDFASGHHRDGEQVFLDHSKFSYVQADIIKLPFSDKSFDYVICIQVLEHIEDIASACKELMRVANRGFIETPRKWTEFYAGHPTHLWMIDEYDGKLIFEPVMNSDSLFMNFALPPLWRSQQLQEKLNIYTNIPCIQLAWKDKFDYKLKETKTHDFLHSDKNSYLRHYHFAKNLLYWMAPPDKGLFHAEYAYKESNNNPEILDLYTFYLALSGNWREAFEKGLSIKRFVLALVVTCIRNLADYLSTCYTKMIEHLFWNRL